MPLQSLADPVAGLGTLSAVESHYQQEPGYAVATLSKLEPLHERVFELLGFRAYQAPALLRRPRRQPSHQRPVRNAVIVHQRARLRSLTKSLK